LVYDLVYDLVYNLVSDFPPKVFYNYIYDQFFLIFVDKQL
jgi:hypothetical protein